MICFPFKKITALYWNLLKPKIPEFFKGIDVKPSLVHGNLRSENIGRSGSKPGYNNF